MCNVNFLIQTGMLIGIIVGAIVGVAIIILFLCFVVFKSKKPRIKINESFMNSLVQNLGNKENIISAKNINGRVNIEVADLEKVCLEELKKISTAGVFITNQTIKLLFSYDSEIICKSLNKD